MSVSRRSLWRFPQRLDLEHGSGALRTPIVAGSEAFVRSADQMRLDSTPPAFNKPPMASMIGAASAGRLNSGRRRGGA